MHGTFSSLGDYDTCLENDRLQYCTVHLRPILPMRKPFENINTRISILSKFIEDKDQAISKIAENAQLFYYTAMRIGVCLPSDCSSIEVGNLLQSGIIIEDLNFRCFIFWKVELISLTCCFSSGKKPRTKRPAYLLRNKPDLRIKAGCLHDFSSVSWRLSEVIFSIKQDISFQFLGYSLVFQTEWAFFR